MFKKGECTSKKFICTPDWKCVDFRINTKYPSDEAKKVIDECRKSGYFDVCEWCRYFKAAPDQEKPGEVKKEPAPDLDLTTDDRPRSWVDF